MKTSRFPLWFIGVLLLLTLVACRPASPGRDDPGPPPPPATATAMPTATPAAAAIAGRWRQEVAAEGLSYTTIIEFFADGLFSATVNGVFSPCLFLPDLCGLFPAEMPLALTYTGDYTFIAADRVRLELEEPVDDLSAYFLPQFDQRLEAFAVALPDADTLGLEQDGRSFIYQRVR